MLGFLVLIFLYLFAVLARNTEKPARSSLVRSLVLAGLFLLVLSMFSVVTIGVLFLFLFFLPFFFFPGTKNKPHYRFEQDEKIKEFFEQMRRQQQYQQSQQSHQGHHRSSARTASKGMSVYDAAKLLGVSIDATMVEVKTVYRKLMLKHHPDKGGSAEYAAKLNTARDVMIDYINQKIR
ncbi:MAG: DnaJ domain-containing protein [Candidatus Paracaedibacteraceae bacterium]|nr:DnaJ domain-containing protein [Candidatus Paracaedibacteraceae bacterium]